MQARQAVGSSTKPLAAEPVILAIVLGILLALRLISLRYNETDLFFDEAQYWSWSRELAFGYYSKPPLIAWMIGAATSVCGDGTACIRSAAPVLHTGTSIFIYLSGTRLHGRTVGLLSALAFATLPGVSLSSGIISTDVPLLLCWSVALWGYVALHDGRAWGPAIVLGLAFGLGLNAKYAMAFFVLCVAVHMSTTPKARTLLADARLWTALALGLALILPNMAWNLSNGFATFAHTADNAKWSGAILNIGKGLEFFAAQAGVFGPVLFGGLLVIAYSAWRDGLPGADRLLLAFTLPVLLLITAQAFRSRAHANWAAVSYVAGVILVTATFVRWSAVRWLGASLALHTAVFASLAVATGFAGRLELPRAGDPFQRTLGWKGIAEAAGEELEKARSAGKPYRALMADDRSLTAELLYYLRNERTPIVAWREGSRPLDHYEMTRSYQDAPATPVLLVSIRADREKITRHFSTADDRGQRTIPAGRGEPRTIHLLGLSGFSRK